MANNRMYLRCKGCGKEMVLAKMFPGTGYYFTKTAEEKGRELADFLKEHSIRCHEYDKDGAATCNAFDEDFEPFELVYENNPNY